MKERPITAHWQARLECLCLPQRELADRPPGSSCSREQL